MSRIKIHLDLTERQARTLLRMVDAAVSYYEGATGDDAYESDAFEALAGDVRPVIRAAISAGAGLCPVCKSAKHARCCARCGKLTRGGREYCSRRCETAQAREDRASAQQESDW